MAQTDYNPSNPPEPSARYKITVSASPNYGYTSGTGWFDTGSQTWISTSSYSPDYVFKYWTKNGAKYTESSSFYYTVETENVNFVAVYTYEPQSPAEPDGITSYRLYLKSNINGSCSFNRTSGEKIRSGSSVYVCAYPNAGYKFKGWYVGDDKQSDSRDLYFQMPEKDITLTAHFEYDPDNPDDPQSAAGQPITTKIKAKNYTREYGEANPVFGYSSNTEITGTPTITCEATKTSPVGTYPIVISRGSVEGEDVILVNGTLTITKAPLVIQGGNYSKKQGEENPAFVLTYSGLKNDETEAVLSTPPTVTCSAEKISPAGVYDVKVSGGTAVNYDITCTDGTLTIIEADAIVLTADNLTRVYGEPNPELTYSVTGAELSGTPVLSCEATATSPVGTYDILISKGTVSNYNDTYVKGTLTITKAPLSISAGNYSKKQGEANPEFALTYTGFKNDETSAVLKTQPTVSCEATASSAVGSYDVIVSGAKADNYEITHVNGKLTVSEADAVVITANNLTRVYGEANPELTYSVTGAELSGTPVLSCEATATSPVGTYDILISKGTVSNYNDTYVKGTLTITKAPLKISAGSYTKKQGEDNPNFTLTYDGFKNGDTEDSFTTQPTVSCSATKDSPVGDYDVTVSGAVSGNYNISYVNGSLTIEAAPTPEPEPEPEPQVTTFDEDVDNSSNKIIITFVVKENDSSGTPTVAISDDKDASGSVSISETVTHNGVEYKVTEIGEGAFQNNTGLTEVSIPASITSIGASAFAGCTNLKSITVYNETPINLSVVSARGFTRTDGSSVFEGVDKETCILYVPEGSVDAYKAAPGWKDFKNILAIGTTGIYGIVVSNGEAFDVFSISGQKVKAKATSLDGLPMGIYIINGKKVIKQ